MRSFDPVFRVCQNELGMLKLFDRYVLREIASPFLIGLGVYSFGLLMNQLLQFPELFIARGVPFLTTLRLLIYLVPAILAFTVPMSVLMGILAGLSRLSADSEITAFKTLGIGPRRLLRPLLLFAFAGWAATSVLSLSVVPDFNYKWVRTMAEAVAERTQVQLSPREFNDPLPNVMIYFQDLTPDREWSNAFIYTGTSAAEPRLLLARRGRFNVSAAKKRAVLELFDVAQHEVVLAEPDRYPVSFYGRVEEELDAESLFGTISTIRRVREKTIGELLVGSREVRARRKELRRKGPSPELTLASDEARSHDIEIHKRLALPFACWIFAFLGLPLGISTKKGGRTSGFTLSILIIIAYYILITAGENLAMKGRIPPWLGMWLANIVFAAFGLRLFSRSAREVSFLPAFLRRPARAGAEAVAGAAPSAEPGRRRVSLGLRFPNILDRYVLRKYALISGLAFTSLIVLASIVTFFEQLDNLYAHHRTVSLLLSYVAARLPEFVNFGLPVAALTGTLLAFGLLTKTNEFTAMKACGIGVHRAIVPVLIMGVLLGLLSFYVQENILPRSNRKAQELWNELNDVPVQTSTIYHRRWLANRERDRFYYYRYFDPQKAAWRELSIFDLDTRAWTVTRRIYAARADLAGGTARLRDGWIREFRQGLPIRYEKFDTYDLPLAQDRGLFWTEAKEPGQMTFAELRGHVREVRDMGFDTRRLRVDLHVKLSFPLVALIMTLLGLPFAFSMGKRGALVGVGISVGIAAAYWVTIGVFKSMGYVGFLSPFLAAWGPNLLYGLLGGYLLLRVRT